MGKEHPEYATSLSNLALTYGSLGDYTKSLELNLECLSLTEKLLGKEHPGYATSLNNLAANYSDLGDYQIALELSLECLACRKEIQGKEHPDYALSVNNLAVSFRELGDYTKSLELNLECLSLTEKIYGKDHPDYAQSLSNLALTYLALGDYGIALELNLECLSLREKIHGKEHPNYALSLSNVMFSHFKVEDVTSAYQVGLEWLDWSASQLQANESTLNTDLRQKHYSAHLQHLSWVMQLAHLSSSPWPYAHWLRARGRDLGTTQLLSRAIASSADPTLRVSFEEMRSVNAQVARLQEKLVENPSLRSAIDGLKETSSALERELMQGSEVFAALKQELSVSRVVGVLEAGEAFVDILPLPVSEFDTSYTYMAFVLKAGATSFQEVVLGEGDVLDEAFSMYQSYTTNPSKDPSLYGGVCHAMYWSKLDSVLTDVHTVYLSPDGVYAKMNAGVFYDEGTSAFLTDRLEIRLVSSGAELVRQRTGFYDLLTSDLDLVSSALLVGNPQFDLDAVRTRGGSESLAYARDLRSVIQDTLLRRDNITRLPGTADEVAALKEVFKLQGWDVQLLTEKKASEEGLKATVSPTILHLATHGYFLPNVPVEQMDGRSLGGESKQSIPENPMYRSGLLLAGAENTLRGEVLEGTENGWFSAEEASSLNLLGTELVVMSACETGKGDIQNGRGVFGLQRAMRAAGAESVVMSLWSVDDAATSDLMQSFYGHWLAGSSTPDALRLAQFEMREQQPHPYYWGAWVCSGE